MQNLEAFRELINTPKKIVITTHFKPDADALGSSLGLARYLKKKGHQITVITPSDYPKFLFWMPNNEEVINYEDYKLRAKSNKLIAEAEVIFCLDFSALSRIESMTEPVRQSQAIKVMIDHHTFPEDFAQFSYHDTNAAATAQLIFQLIVLLGDEALLDVAICECLYAGIMTDTGSFRHPSTTPAVHRIVADIMEIGVNTNLIHRRIYDSTTAERLNFLGYVLSEKLVVLPEYRVAYFTVTEEELKRFNSQTGDTEGIVNYGLQIEGMVMSAIIVDRPEAVKMSFRSVEEFAVNKIASKYFSGGGHKNASGGKTTGIGLDATVEKFISILPEYQSELLAVPL
ncbi:MULTISPECIES: bifunctional oligoribonuclease/PAP phosphatase NrnA [Arcicella]|uniref:Bifunctional oligoribonuclease/PAP phosphatase NrnA n=1 Tax=Arcicella aquatica TaxID=217141 RepID=A0ABU5QW89_9BACT|nr:MULTISPECIES: bifunctional oligoribonuclease/PAP phosphatase NrnA [Arcicella]MDR6563660.1 phosphoesterase RecJ-like protein [Arcicella sp. BE51]MDR6814202.1 phosphoesterase RecJ-like protein [Arcicella sp. BE140]MDR6825559.1 phosphoesterase RecJ-like protein [Arcicella sp. BE139]MEA5260995.1 bifunctional oligoribonuclease/PAP phosphatase NrnA [Arcicella aquatica]